MSASVKELTISLNAGEVMATYQALSKMKGTDYSSLIIAGHGSEVWNLMQGLMNALFEEKESFK